VPREVVTDDPTLGDEGGVCAAATPVIIAKAVVAANQVLIMRDLREIVSKQNSLSAYQSRSQVPKHDISRARQCSLAKSLKRIQARTSL
jgi:hypothetical protein